MTSFLSVLCLNAALLGSTVELKLTGNAQLRAGYTHTPYVGGADGVLLNAPVTTQGSAQTDLILTPGVEFDWTYHNFKLRLGYAPRLFIDLLAISSVPTVFHKANLDLSLGRANSWDLSAGAALSIGGLDTGQAAGGAPSATAVSQSFVGSLRPGSTADSAALGFFNLSAYAKGETNFARSWKFTSLENLAKRDTPPQDASTVLGSGRAVNPNEGGGITFLQSQQTAESKNTFDYRINDQHHLLIDILFNVTYFQNAETYASITPTLGWDAAFSKLTRFRLVAGLMRYWTSPYPGRLNQSQYLVVGTISVDHVFADWGMPRLTGRLSITEGPYYDIIYGVLDPRGTLNAELAYKFDRDFEGALQVRYYTELYPKHVVPVGHDKNVAIVSVNLKYRYSRWLSYQAGLYGLARDMQTSHTQTDNTLYDVYGLVGVTGNYDVD